MSVRIKFTVGFKFTSLIVLLLLTSIASIVWLSTRLFVRDNTALIQQMNSDLAASKAEQTKQLLQELTQRANLFGTVLGERQTEAKSRNRLLSLFFENNPDFIGVILYQHRAKTSKVRGFALSPSFAKGDTSQKELISRFIVRTDRFSIQKLAKGERQLSFVTLPEGSPAFLLGLPFIADTKKKNVFLYSLVAVFHPKKIWKTFEESDLVNTYLTDKHGNLLAHADTSLVSSYENVSYLKLVKQLIEGKFHNGQTEYFDPTDKIEKLGAFRTIGFAGLGVIAEVSKAKAFEAAKKVQTQSILLAGIILFVSILAGYLYSNSISWPLTILAKAAQQIAKGNFSIKLRAKNKDEVGYLSETFNEMVDGLQERDRVKATFNKFHNKEIAEKLLSGDVKLGGERMDATVFFSDIRSFTAISERMEPDQVVEMLNEYFTVMVPIIRKHHGIVDKYVGDAIMALWGIPFPSKDDCENALNACLEMRKELEKLNKKRIERGQPALRFGIGLNRGPVTAGNIGSEEKMEYTVIGDTVNLASRIETITKTAGTDLLIAKEIYERVSEKYVCEPCGAIKVLGKVAPVEVYKVRGYITTSGEKVIVETPYSQFAPENSDKVQGSMKAA